MVYIMNLRDSILRERHLFLQKPTTTKPKSVHDSAKSLLQREVESHFGLSLTIIINQNTAKQCSVRELASYLSFGNVIVSKSTAHLWRRQYQDTNWG